MSERQHSIDLLPDSVRARSQAGVRLGQFIAVAIVSMTLTIAAATHSRLSLATAQERLFSTAARAEQVFATEARAAQLRHELGDLRAFTRQYERLALPLDVGDVLATLVNILPDSVCLDQLDLDAGTRVINLGPRSRGAGGGGGGGGGAGPNADGSAPPRVLTAEISGFAASDQHIAELVSKLESITPFENVSLDFSRSRKVNDKDAREFRVSFRIDLDKGYRVTHVEQREVSRCQGVEVSRGSPIAGAPAIGVPLDTSAPRHLGTLLEEVANAND